MTDRCFQITFSGKLLTGFARAQVMPNLAKVFKISEAKAKALLNGRKHILKKNMDALSAKKYQSALMKIGVDVSIENASQIEKRKTPLQQSMPTAAAVEPRKPNPVFAAKTNAAVASNMGMKGMPSQARPAGRTQPDCPSQPVSLARTTPIKATAKVSTSAARATAPLGLVGDEKSAQESKRPTIQSALAQYRAQTATKLLPQSKLPSKMPTTDSAKMAESTPRQSTALEDLQRLLEKSRKSKQVVKPSTLSPDQTQKLPNNLLAPKQSNVVYDKDKLTTLLGKTKQRQEPKETTTASPLKSSRADTVRLHQKPSDSVRAKAATPLKISARPKTSVLPDLPSSADLAAGSQATPEKRPRVEVMPPVQAKQTSLPVAPISRDATAPDLVPQQKDAAQKAKPEPLFRQSEARKSGAGQSATEDTEKYKPFEQPTLLSCAICRQTQHTAPHCLNCGSEFESAPDRATSEDHLAATFAEDDYENTPLEKVLWPGVTVLLFLYTLIFVFKLPLITFWVPADTFDNIISVELKAACDEKETCLHAVNEQLDSCIEKSGIYDYDPEAPKKLTMGAYLDRISTCIVDVNNNAYFGTGEHTPFKNLQ